MPAGFIAPEAIRERGPDFSSLASRPSQSRPVHVERIGREWHVDATPLIIHSLETAHDGKAAPVHDEILATIEEHGVRTGTRMTGRISRPGYERVVFSRALTEYELAPTVEQMALGAIRYLTPWALSNRGDDLVLDHTSKGWSSLAATSCLALVRTYDGATVLPIDHDGAPLPNIAMSFREGTDATWRKGGLDAPAVIQLLTVQHQVATQARRAARGME